MNKKIAIVCSGGGMRCGYAAGVYVALAKELNFTTPEIIIAGSGGASSSLYYLAQQYEAIKKMATELLANPKFISPTRFWKIVDVDFLVDTIFKKYQPLDLERLSSTKSNYFILAQNIDTGVTHYFTKKDKIDLFEILKATTAAPFFYGKKISIDGSRYVDGTTYSSLKKMVDKAIELGADKVLVIDCRTLMTRLPTYKIGQVFVLRNLSIPSQLLTRNYKKLQKTYDMGYDDVFGNEDLRAWLTN